MILRQFTQFSLIASCVMWARLGHAAACDDTIHQGVATYYEGDATGVCGYPADTANHMYVALDAPEIESTAMCGACIHVWGPSGEITVLVVNGCPGCEVGHLDLSPEAYQLVAANYNGVPPITWQYVPCDVIGPIRYAYFSGSTTAWAWVQVRNHRNPIASLEARMADGTYVTLERSDWGYFKALNLPDGGQTYRVTDIYGQVLEDSGIAVLDQGEVEGAGQFPSCTGLPDAGGDPISWGGSGTTAAKGSNGGGCGCRVASTRGSGAGSAALLVALVAAIRGIRRRTIA